MTNRAKYQKRVIKLVGQMQKDTAKTLIDNVPLDIISPIEIVIREEVKSRNNVQNSLMWAGALKDIETQAWLNGKQFSSEVWHEHFKREYLPEEYTEGITKDGYRKWDYTPKGERVLVGSTTDLTTRGFGEYLEQIYAFGASLGVRFSTVERY